MSITRWKVGDVIGESECGSFVAYTDHAAAVARLESRLSLAEKVVEAATKENERLRAFLSWAWNQKSSQVTFSIDDEAAINLDVAASDVWLALSSYRSAK